MVINQSDGILARLAITNILWIALLGASWKQGWLQYIFEKDLTFISHGIALFSVMVVILSLRKGFNIATMLERPAIFRSRYVKPQHMSEAERRDVLKTELVGNISFVEYFATTALAVGVLGTVIGLILGFQNVDPSSLSNVENAGATVAEVLQGLSVAFHTTLVGGIANLWLRTNHYMLMHASSRVYSKTLEG